MAANPSTLPFVHPVADGPRLAPSRRLRASPYDERVRAAAPRAVTVYNHMLLPVGYASPEEDYWHLLERVQIWDVSAQRQVEIAGRDALRLVEYMTPRPVASTAVGQCRYLPLTEEHGGIVNDPVALRLDEDRFWLSIADADVLLWAKGLAHGRGLEVSVHEPDVAPLAVQGPLAERVVQALFGDWVGELGFFRFRATDLDGIPLLVARSGWSKQGGFELYLRDSSRGLELWDRVVEAGREHDIRPGGPNAIERVESGLLSYGSDMTLDDSPRQCGLDDYCKLDKRADFAARDALVREACTPGSRRLARVVIDGPPVDGAALPWPVLDGARAVGMVTSAAWSPRLGRNVAFAMLPLPLHERGPVLATRTSRGTFDLAFVGDINADGWD